jgi:hypothetical protein
MTEYVNLIRSLHNLNVLVDVPSLNRVFDLLLDSQAPLLTPTCYKDVNKKSRVFTKHVDDFQAATKSLDNFISALAVDKVQPKLASPRGAVSPKTKIKYFLSSIPHL